MPACCCGSNSTAFTPNFLLLIFQLLSLRHTLGNIPRGLLEDCIIHARLSGFLQFRVRWFLLCDSASLARGLCNELGLQRCASKRTWSDHGGNPENIRMRQTYMGTVPS
ncbi:hypothetical protein BDZ89DRAFT_148644 [Hymenopellis radicata]|nr:hypothetical protein BDZ89DRAFT_148644 [Hymenopellis radicata]